jgi:hypothetical protein
MPEALNQYNLPNALVAEILAANPTAAKSDNIREAMDSRPVPFDEWQREMVLAGATVMGEKEDLEQWMAGAIEKRSLAMDELFHAIWNDSLIMDKFTPMISLLDEQNFYPDLLCKTDLLAGFGNYDLAIDLAASAGQMYRLSAYQTSEWTTWADVLNIEQLFVNSGREALNEVEVAALSDYYYNAPARAGSRALSLLVAFGGMEYLEPIIEDTNEPKKLQLSAKSRKVPVIRAYPNPATDMLIAEWKDLDMSELQLSDLTGRVLHKVLVAKGQRQAVLQLGELSTGMYILSGLDWHGRTHSFEVIKQ